MPVVVPPLGKLKTVTRVFILATVFFFLGYIYPAAAKYKCGNISSVFKEVMQQGYAYVSTAESGQDGASVSLFIDPFLNWKILGVDKNLNACVLLSGNNWIFFRVNSL